MHALAKSKITAYDSCNESSCSAIDTRATGIFLFLDAQTRVCYSRPIQSLALRS